MSNKKYNKQAVMHLLRSYAEFQKKYVKQMNQQSKI